MTKGKKLRARQAKMFAKHHRVQPWDNLKREQHEVQHTRLMHAFAAGLSDEKIALVFKMKPRSVAWFRLVEYPLWQKRVTECSEHF